MPLQQQVGDADGGPSGQRLPRVLLSSVAKISCGKQIRPNATCCRQKIMGLMKLSTS